MFKRVKDQTLIEHEIERAFARLSDLAMDTEEYRKILDHITELHRMKEAERPSRVSPDTWATIGANILGIVLIIRHEHVNVITSRAMNLVPKLK